MLVRCFVEVSFSKRQNLERPVCTSAPNRFYEIEQAPFRSPKCPCRTKVQNSQARYSSWRLAKSCSAIGARTWSALSCGSPAVKRDQNCEILDGQTPSLTHSSRSSRACRACSNSGPRFENH